MELALFPLNYRVAISQFKVKYGFSIPKIEILLLSSYRETRPTDVGLVLIGLNRIYDGFLWLRANDYVKRIQKGQPLNGRIKAKSSLYVITPKGRKRAEEFIKLLVDLNERAVHGYF